MDGAVQCYKYWLGVLILVLPWCVATILTWIYTEVFAVIPSSSTGSEENNPLGSAGGKTISIIQTTSVVVYVFYIFLALTCIGFSGRKSIFSYCCLVVGVMVFTVIPVAAGSTLLVVALLSFSENPVGARVGIAAAVFCFLSTAICLVMTCWALMCGSRRRGKNHRYPIPLAYLPYVRDFEKIRTEVEVRDVNRHTEDYPSPLHSFSDHNTDPVGRYVIPPKSSGKQDQSGRKASVISSDEVSKDRKLSAVSSNKSFSSSTINAERKVVVNTQSTSDSRKFSVGSATNSTNSADRKYSLTSLPRATRKLSAENLANQSSRDRSYSVNSRIVSTGSSAGPMKALPYKYSVGSSTSQPNVVSQNMSNGTDF